MRTPTDRTRLFELAISSEILSYITKTMLILESFVLFLHSPSSKFSHSHFHRLSSGKWN